MTAEDEVEEKTEFKFSELSEAAKARVRDKRRESQVDYNWWDYTYTYDDAVAIAALMGIEISTTERKGQRGQKTYSYKDIDIQFQGFWSQGDGCSFSGTLRAKNMKGAVNKMKDHVGSGNSDIHKFAKQAEQLYGHMVVAWTKARFLGGVESHEETPDDTYFGITASSRYYRTTVDVPISIYDHLEDDLSAFVDDFAGWIYKQLEAEYEHLTSDEVIDERIEDEELFDEDGNAI